MKRRDIKAGHVIYHSGDDEEFVIRKVYARAKCHLAFSSKPPERGYAELIETSTCQLATYPLKRIARNYQLMKTRDLSWAQEACLDHA